MSVSEAQNEANKGWADKNKERRTYLSMRSTARSFIRNKARMEDIEELQQLIKNRIDDLK